MSYTQNNNQSINLKSYTYSCGIQIYWNSSVNEYWYVFSQKKHICPYRQRQSKPTSTPPTIQATTTKPTYSNYSKIP